MPQVRSVPAESLVPRPAWSVPQVRTVAWSVPVELLVPRPAWSVLVPQVRTVPAAWSVS